MVLVALLCVGSSQTRGRARGSCLGRWILYHRAPRDALAPLAVKDSSLGRCFHAHLCFLTFCLCRFPSASFSRGLSLPAGK